MELNTTYIAHKIPLYSLCRCVLRGLTSNWAKSSALFSKKVTQSQRAHIKGIFSVQDFG
jgi:hypothetical protein